MKTSTLDHISRKFHFVMLTLLCIAIVALQGCGGSSSSGDPNPSTASGFSAGQISGFGSIIVNGVRFHTGGATLEFEDGSTVILTNSNNEDHLSRGMEVEIEGAFDDNGNGTATRVSVDSTLQGPVTGLTSNAGLFRFSILGQTVVATSGLTVVDDTVLNGSLASLTEDMVVEVHGLPDGNGTVQASFIEWKAVNAGSLPPGSLELTGTVNTLDTNAETFLIGTQQVSYSGITPRDGVLTEGALVEVKGDLSGGTLVATEVEIKNGFDDRPKTELEGLVTSLNTTAQSFMLRGQLVDYSNARFEGGTEQELINGLKVEAEGPISAGVLLAVKIKFKDNFRYEGEATLAGDTLSINNPSGPDLNVVIDSAMTLGSSSGGQVKIRARQLSGVNLVATRVEDGGNEGRQIFQAPVVRIAEPLVELLDIGNGSSGLIVVDTSTIDADDFEIGDQVSTRQAFFANLQVGDIVKARWDVDAGEWDQVEIELDD